MVSLELDLFLQARQNGERMSWKFGGTESRVLNEGFFCCVSILHIPWDNFAFLLFFVSSSLALEQDDCESKSESSCVPGRLLLPFNNLISSG
jgi:hypothetical protein